MVFHIKNREHLIGSVADIGFLHRQIIEKAHTLDAYVEELGGWRDHIHVLIRTAPTIALSDVYRQLKGYSATQWRKAFEGRPFKWGDGAYVATVDADHCDGLREYIRGQWEKHETKMTISAFERD